MTEEIYKSEEFYKDLYNASKKAVNQYLTNAYNKTELIDAGIDYVLNKIDTLNLTGDRNTDFYILMKRCSAGIAKFIYNKRELFLEELNESNNLRGDSYVVENLMCKDLIKLLKDFLINYDPTKRKIVLLYLNFQNMRLIASKIGTNQKVISETIKAFQNSFAEYLLNVGYLNDCSVLNDRKATSSSQIKKNSYLRKRNVLSFDSYKNDFKIYKLLRDEDDLIKFADFLNVSLDFLNDVIYHRKSRLNLSYVDIEKLHSKFFKDYSFLELVEA